MIELEFKIDPEQILPKYLKCIKSTLDLAIQINCFIMPVRFQINGESLFYLKKTTDSPWKGMPLIDFATYFLRIIKTLPIKNKDKFIFSHEGYAAILLEMVDKKKARIFSGETKKAYIVDYDELLKVFEVFEKNVKKFLNENVLPLKEHPYWGPWLKGEVEWDADKGLVPIKNKKK